MNLDSKKVRTATNGMPFVPPKLIESSNKWYIEYYIFDENINKLRRKRFFKLDGKTPTEKRNNAKLHIYRLNKALQSGVYIKVEEIPIKAWSVKDAIEEVIKIKSKELPPESSARTRYKSMLGIFLDYLDTQRMIHRPVETIKTSDIVLFLDWLMDTMQISRRTRNNYRQYLSSAFNLMEERDWIPNNPVKKTLKLSVAEKEYRSFSKGDYERLNQHLMDNHHRLWQFCQFIYYGFLRPKEITRMKISHIDLRKKVILIAPTDTKNGKFRPIEITKSLRHVIESMNLSDYPPDHYVFSGAKGWVPGTKYLWRARVTEYHKEVLKEIGLDDPVYTLYSHKHTGNEHAILAGLDVYWIKNQNRHSSLEQTMIYLRGLGVIRTEAQDKDW